MRCGKTVIERFASKSSRCGTGRQARAKPSNTIVTSRCSFLTSKSNSASNSDPQSQPSVRPDSQSLAFSGDTVIKPLVSTPDDYFDRLLRWLSLESDAERARLAERRGLGSGEEAERTGETIVDLVLCD